MTRRQTALFSVSKELKDDLRKVKDKMSQRNNRGDVMRGEEDKRGEGLQWQEMSYSLKRVVQNPD